VNRAGAGHHQERPAGVFLNESRSQFRGPVADRIAAEAFSRLILGGRRPNLAEERIVWVPRSIRAK
jgi:hypothetical protein